MEELAVGFEEQYEPVAPTTDLGAEPIEGEVKAVDTLPYDDNVKKDYVPEGFDTVEAFLEDLRDEYQKDLDFDRVNRDEAVDDKRFSAGEQWDPIVLEHRKGLPCLTINSVPQFVAQLVGDWRENKNGIKVVPAEDGDVEIASMRGDLIRAIQTSSRASRIYDNAFESMVQCGDGAFRIAVCYARNDVFDQDIEIKPIDDALSVVWDRFSVDPTGRDARHVFVDDLLSRKEFTKKWPNLDPSTLGEQFRSTLYGEGWITEDGVRVTEYWRLIEREKLLGLFENGSVRFLSENNDDLIAQNGKIIRTRMSPVVYAQMHIVTGFAILSGPYEYQLSRVPIIRMAGRTVNIQGRRVRYGLVRFMKDPVRLKNFWRSVAAEQLGYAPKAQWIAPESAVEGREDTFRKAHLSRDPLIVYNDGAEAPPTRLDPPVPQAALLNEAQVNAQDMKDVTGIHDASLGIKSNETSGRAIQARQREGDIASLTFYDNGNASILEAGDVINQLIGQVYDGTRIVRVIGEDEAIKFAKINDPADPSSPDLSIGKYDVAMTSGTSYTTRRVEAAQAMMEAIQVWPQLIQVAGDVIAKAQDWPGADKLAERLRKTIPPQFLDEGEEGAAPAIDPAMVQEMQMQLQTLAQENQQLKTDKTIEFEKLKIDGFNAETQRLKVVAESELKNTELGVKTIIEAVKSPDPAPDSSTPGGSKTATSRTKSQ
jgi:hypothetical protein